jgi:hypothetical protein
MTTQIQEVIHKDLFGHDINTGTVVAYARSNMMHIGVVGKMTKKMIKVNSVNGYVRGECLQYPENTIVLDSPEVTMYMLKKQR